MFERDSDAFRRALDDAAQNDRAPNENGWDAARGPRMRGVAFGPAPSAGGEARFGFALDWTDELADRPAPPPPPCPWPECSGDPFAEVARELGFDAPLTLDQQTSRWRDFVWRNHPDRQRVDARAQANVRVAIANTLYDQARRQFIRGRPHSSPASAAR